MIRLSCRDSVSSDLASILGPLPEDELASYQFTHELYGSTRMLLACLTREQLTQVRHTKIQGQTSPICVSAIILRMLANPSPTIVLDCIVV